MRPLPAATPVRPAGRWFCALGAGLVWALAACQAPAPAAVPPVADAPADEPADQAPSTGAAAAPPEPATAALPPEPVIDDDPQQLVGIGPVALSAILGEPELIRREAPAEIWQYRGDDCVFDVFLYDTAGRREVTYVEARDVAAQRSDARACLNGLLRARQARPLG